MRSVNNETRLTMNKRRNFVNYATMTLADGTVLNLTPSDFRLAGQSFTDDWVDGEAFQIGTAIGKTATILLDNTDNRVETVGTSTVTYPHGKFSEYDFYMAYFVLYVCLPDAYTYGSSIRDEMIRIGTFTVTTPVSHGATIEIVGVDNMYMFDKSFDECDLDFSTHPTLINILNKCCDDCNVAIGYTTFDNQSLTVSEKPENATYRQVVAWIAQIAGCNAVISQTGALTLKSYDMSAFATDLDGGSFIAIGEEFAFMTAFSPSYVYPSATGWNIYYPRLSRTGTYRLSKIKVFDVEDPSTFAGKYKIYEYDNFQLDGNGNFNRYNDRLLEEGDLVIGDNYIDIEFTISTINDIVYNAGACKATAEASDFKVQFYLTPISYSDRDSADGGTFEPERRYIGNCHWSYDGQSTSTGWWFLGYSFLNSVIKPVGNYKITKIVVTDIIDPSHFNAYYRIRKSVDGGVTWTELIREPITSGVNIIDYDIEVVQGDEIRYSLHCGQEIASDPDASEFYFDVYFKADDTVYLNGDVIDGGNFTEPLPYHNLTALNGTTIGTDDIQFTGVQIKNDGSDIHYPTATGWDYYAMLIEDNPFTEGHESTIAQSVYTKISSLKFRPFTTSSIQDPTIEAGDSAIIYDVKGNSYPTVITNVVFRTGGMTELSCNAESPAKQGSRYVSQAAYAVSKAEKKQDDYNAQVAHFNEIASAALGYYKTEEVDSQTGATITYLHNLANLADSDIVVKIANGIIAISDNYNTPQRSWNTGLDVSTGTMLLNLIYVRGLTSDWIRTGELIVGGVDNIDGIIHVVNEQKYADGDWDGTGHTGGALWSYYTIKFQWIKPAGTYKFTKIVIDNVSSEADFVDFKYKIEIKANGETYYRKIQEGPLVVGENIINYVFEITETDDYTYNFVVGKNNVVATDPTFDYHFYTTRVNTTIDKDGVQINRGSIKLGAENSSTHRHSFEVDDSGELYSISGKIAGYDIDPTNGFTHVGYDDYYCEYSRFKLHLGGLWGTTQDGYWTLFAVGNKGEFAHIDTGASTSGGLWITKNGTNNPYDFSGNVMHMWAENIYSNLHGNPQWAGSDRKLKQNIEDLDISEAEELIQSVRPRKFEFKHEAGKKRYGFIAQEVREILPDDSGVEYEDHDMCNINYTDFIAPLCKIVQEQQKEIEELKQRIAKLEEK